MFALRYVRCACKLHIQNCLIVIKKDFVAFMKKYAILLHCEGVSSGGRGL